MGPTAVPTSLVPEDVIGSIIESNPTALLPSIVPTSALDPDLVSNIITTATNLAPGATGIPIGDIPTTAVVSFDPTAVPTSLLPTGILPSIVSEVTQLPTVIPTSAINPLT